MTPKPTRGPAFRTAKAAIAHILAGGAVFYDEAYWSSEWAMGMRVSQIVSAVEEKRLYRAEEE